MLIPAGMYVLIVCGTALLVQKSEFGRGPGEGAERGPGEGPGEGAERGPGEGPGTARRAGGRKVA